MNQPQQVYISLGSNKGDRFKNLQDAIDLIYVKIGNVKISIVRVQILDLVKCNFWTSRVQLLDLAGSIFWTPYRSNLIEVRPIISLSSSSSRGLFNQAILKESFLITD